MQVGGVGGAIAPTPASRAVQPVEPTPVDPKSTFLRQLLATMVDLPYESNTIHLCFRAGYYEGA